FRARDQEVVAVLDGVGLQARQVRAGAGLGIALAPDDLAAQGRADPAGLLLFRADLQQGRDQHGDALPGHAARRARGDEFLGDDAALQYIRLGAEAAV